MFSERKLSYYINEAESVDTSDLRNEIRLAILSSFSLTGLAETLTVKCSAHKVRCRTYVSAYDQYNQEILNPKSKLYSFSPDITFLVLDSRTILRDLFYWPYSLTPGERRKYIENKSKDILQLIDNLTISLNSKLVISNFDVPNYSPYGIYETKTEYGLQRMIRDLNDILSIALVNEPHAYIYDFNLFVNRYGEVNVFDYRQFLHGDVKVSLNYIPYLAEDFMGYVKPFCGLNRKCIVLDLDNTLWGGILGEDGFERIALGPKAPGNAFVEFQRVIMSLYKRGIILAINSRNNAQDALKVIRDHPYMVLREEDFASIKINWNDKISNIKEIAEDLNIGLDSIVYVDDDPVNRELMSKAIPEVLTIDLPKDPSLYCRAITELNDFNVLKVTEEDTKRGKMYIQQRKRREIEKTVSNLDEFLSQLNIRISIKRADPFTIPRIAQLTLKTNQFNLTTHRYQEQDISKFSQDKSMLVGCARIEDKFGDNGITGAFIVRKNNSNEWSIDTFLLSCRVMGRAVEDAIMAFILDEARKEGVTKITAQYIPTEKNKPCEDFLTHCGFRKDGDYWIYQSDFPLNIPSHLQLVVE